MHNFVKYFVLVQNFIFYPVEDSYNLKVLERRFQEIYRYQTEGIKLYHMTWNMAVIGFHAT
jgi:hypothetical protein